MKFNSPFYLLLAPAILLFFACDQSPKSDATERQPATLTQAQPDTATSLRLHELFTQSDAEKIMGESVVLQDSSSQQQQGIKAFQISYSSGRGGDESGNIYFLIEEYRHLADAQNKYAFIKASNENSPGFRVLEGIGDEAYFHSDQQNFYFTMARKGKRVMSMKVNKLTDKTSETEFISIAGRIAKTM